MLKSLKLCFDPGDVTISTDENFNLMQSSLFDGMSIWVDLYLCPQCWMCLFSCTILFLALLLFSIHLYCQDQRNLGYLMVGDWNEHVIIIERCHVHRRENLQWAYISKKIFKVWNTMKGILFYSDDQEVSFSFFTKYWINPSSLFEKVFNTT